jgi:hypothetical protein
MSIRYKIIFLFFLIFNNWTSSAFCNEKIIAIVNDKPIYYSDIQISQNNKNNIPYQDKAREIEKLKNKIYEIVREDALDGLNIEVSDEEVEAKVLEIYSSNNNDIAIVLKNEIDYFTALYEALRAVRIGGENKDNVYGKMLSRFMSKSEWIQYLSKFDNIQKIENLKNAIPKENKDLIESAKSSARAYVIDEKLKNKMAKDMHVSDMESHEFYENKFKNKKNKPEYQSVENEIKNEIKKIKAKEAVDEWWRARIDDSKINIIDTGYKEAKDKILGKNR